MVYVGSGDAVVGEGLGQAAKAAPPSAGPQLGPRPAIYKGIMFTPSRVPRIGGWLRQPSLGRSYLLAARHVIEAGEREGNVGEVCLPAAFLQRHAVEVQLKQFVAGAFECARNREMYWEIDKDPTINIVAKQPHETHVLAAILKQLRKALHAIDFDEPLPDTIRKLCHQLTKDEKKQHSRFRYLERDGKQSFPTPEVIPVFDRQHAIEELFEVAFHFDPMDDNPATFGGKLFRECYGAGQALTIKEYELGLLDGPAASDVF